MDTAARWVPPPGAEEAGQSTSASTAAAAAQQHHRLCFPNTLAGGAKVPFVPLKTGRVTWYACGPTVYDSAHMGHARAYVSFDIVRRVLEDWFNLDVHLVMNVTDVDDKIISRARRKVVLENYLKSGLDDSSPSPPSAAQVKSDASAALALALAKQELRLKRAQEAAEAEKGREGGVGWSRQASGDGGAAAADTTTTTTKPASAPPASLDRRLAKELAESVSVEGLKTEQLRSASARLERAAEGDLPRILSAAGDVLAEHLDRDRGMGASVTDPAVFRRHASRYEAEFLRDMEALRVRPPSVLTRVSEYMEEIVAYVSRIVESGFGYSVSPCSKSNSSVSDSVASSPSLDVYFDVASFKAAGFPYGRLRPEAAAAGAPGDDEPASPAAASSNGNTAAAAAAAAATEASKRSSADFALWKAAKPGEPSWPSPWGRGRPGWHIECSAMACSILGGSIDIHSGGEDLAFPHHENEIAQADAFYSVSGRRAGDGDGDGGENRRGGCGGCCGGNASPSPPYHRQQWVNYWLHVGHLSIDGLKMSKSLKNFITIKEALASSTPAQLRILFASSRWDKPVTYSPAAAEEARRKEGALKRLFATAAAAKRRKQSSGGGGEKSGDQEPARWDARDAAFEAAVELARDSAHAAFCDGVDSPMALEAVLTLAREAQRYVAACEQKSGATGTGSEGASTSSSTSLPSRQPRALLLSRAASVATRILGALGISTRGSGGSEVGLGGERELTAGASRAVDAVVVLRSAARGAAKAANAAATAGGKKGATAASEVAVAASDFASALRYAAAAAEADARAQLGVALLPEGGKAWAPLPKKEEEPAAAAALAAGAAASSKKQNDDDNDEDDEGDLQAADDPTAAPFLDALPSMLSDVRKAAAEAAKAAEEASGGGGGDAASSAAAVSSASSDLMKAADGCRDGALSSAGVRLEDDADGVGSFWSADAPEALAAEASARVAAAAAARARKAAAAAASASRELEKLLKAEQAPPVQEALRDKFSKFDGAGNPTHAADGKELDERARGKAAKEVEKKRKARLPYEEAVAADPDALTKARAKEVDAKEAAAEAAEVASFAEAAAREAAARAKKLGKKRS